MKGLTCIVGFLIWLCCFSGQIRAADGVYIPSHDSRHAVIDDMDVIDPVTEAEIERFAVENQKTVAIVVLTVEHFSGLSAAEYAQMVFDKWGIGYKGIDNGVLFLYGTDVPGNGDNVRIHTGTGVERYLTDMVTVDILSTSVAPLWQSDKGRAIAAGVRDIPKRLAEEQYAEQVRMERAEQWAQERAILAAKFWDGVLTFLIVLLIAAPFVAIAVIIRKRKQIKRAQQKVVDLEKLLSDDVSVFEGASLLVLESMKGEEGTYLPTETHVSITRAISVLSDEVEYLKTTTTDGIPDTLPQLKVDIAQTEARFNRMEDILRIIDGYGKRIRLSKTRYEDYPKLVDTARSEAAKTQEAVSHPDVSDAIKGYYQLAFAAIPGSDVFPSPQELDYFEAYAALEGTIAQLRDIRSDAIRHQQLVAQARENVPVRIAGMPEKIEAAEERVSSYKGKISGLTKLLNDATTSLTSAVYNSERGMWLQADEALDSADSSLKSIDQKISRYKRKRREEARQRQRAAEAARRSTYTPYSSSSSSSYSSSGGSFGSFGGFGGGRSSGGGGGMRL